MGRYGSECIKTLFPQQLLPPQMLLLHYCNFDFHKIIKTLIFLNMGP